MATQNPQKYQMFNSLYHLASLCNCVIYDLQMDAWWYIHSLLTWVITGSGNGFSPGGAGVGVGGAVLVLNIIILFFLLISLSVFYFIMIHFIISWMLMSMAIQFWTRDLGFVKLGISGSVIVYIPGCFYPWLFFKDIGFNMLPSDSFMSNVCSPIRKPIKGYQTLNLIILASVGATI